MSAAVDNIPINQNKDWQYDNMNNRQETQDNQTHKVQNDQSSIPNVKKLCFFGIKNSCFPASNLINQINSTRDQLKLDKLKIFKYPSQHKSTFKLFFENKKERQYAYKILEKQANLYEHTNYTKFQQIPKNKDKLFNPKNTDEIDFKIESINFDNVNQQYQEDDIKNLQKICINLGQSNIKLSDLVEILNTARSQQNLDVLNLYYPVVKQKWIQVYFDSISNQLNGYLILKTQEPKVGQRLNELKQLLTSHNINQNILLQQRFQNDQQNDMINENQDISNQDQSYSIPSAQASNQNYDNEDSNSLIATDSSFFNGQTIPMANQNNYAQIKHKIKSNKNLEKHECDDEENLEDNDFIFDDSEQKLKRIASEPNPGKTIAMNSTLKASSEPFNCKPYHLDQANFQDLSEYTANEGYMKYGFNCDKKAIQQSDSIEDDLTRTSSIATNASEFHNVSKTENNDNLYRTSSVPTNSSFLINNENGYLNHKYQNINQNSPLKVHSNKSSNENNDNQDFNIKRNASQPCDYNSKQSKIKKTLEIIEEDLNIKPNSNLTSNCDNYDDFQFNSNEQNVQQFFNEFIPKMKKYNSMPKETSDDIMQPPPGFEKKFEKSEHNELFGSAKNENYVKVDKSRYFN